MTVKLSPLSGAGWQFFDENGVPLAGGLLYVYEAGSTTPADTYTSAAEDTFNTNPIELDAAGRVPNEVWLPTGAAYKFALADANDVPIGEWDDISGINDVTVGNIAAGDGQYLRGNGSILVLATIQAGDVPTLNQDTTGNAATATLADAATDAVNALNTPNITGKLGTTKTLSSSAATGGEDGDIWYQY
ncbi:MAG: hypothetical protein ACR2K1_04155 [Saprospiraceae bacterium]